MISVTEIAFTGYPVTDMARARKFYEGVLNLKLAREFGDNGKAWVEYDVGATTLAISNMAPEWKPSADGPSLAFEVADFDAAVASARAAGVRFVFEPMNTGACRFVSVLDPDGNSVTLHKRNAG